MAHLEMACAEVGGRDNTEQGERTRQRLEFTQKERVGSGFLSCQLISPTLRRALV